MSTTLCLDAIRKTHAETTIIFYDGDCYICQHYMRHLRLVESIGPVTNVNLREHADTVTLLREHGFEPNQGMVFVHEDQFYFGSDATQAIALLSTKSSLLNRLNSLVLKYRWTNKLLYPVMKSLRRVSLWVRRKSLI